MIAMTGIVDDETIVSILAVLTDFCAFPLLRRAIWRCPHFDVVQMMNQLAPAGDFRGLVQRLCTFLTAALQGAESAWDGQIFGASLLPFLCRFVVDVDSQEIREGLGRCHNFCR
jgi:hypothetical protein